MCGFLKDLEYMHVLSVNSDLLLCFVSLVPADYFVLLGFLFVRLSYIRLYAEASTE